MRNNLKLVVNNPSNRIEEKHFFEREELKIILDLYAKMVSEGSWKDYGLSISSKQVSFSVFRNATENALYKICKNFKPKNKVQSIRHTMTPSISYSNNPSFEKYYDTYIIDAEGNTAESVSYTHLTLPTILLV